MANRITRYLLLIINDLAISKNTHARRDLKSEKTAKKRTKNVKIMLKTITKNFFYCPIL